jgi:hypothetical protein
VLLFFVLRYMRSAICHVAVFVPKHQRTQRTRWKQEQQEQVKEQQQEQQEWKR